jgi:hypothetical protein
MPVNKQIVNKQSLRQNSVEIAKETLMYCCKCVCSNCVQFRKPIVENKVLDKIVVSW